MSGTSSPSILKRPPDCFRFKLSNPFIFKSGEVFTGFGVGCGVGIGIGRSLNTGSIPMVNQLISSGQFGQLGYQTQNMVRRLGIKNLDAGIGCGIGIGRGFGVGLSLKPGTAEQLWGFLQDGTRAICRRMAPHFGLAPDDIPFPNQISQLSSFEMAASSLFPIPMIPMPPSSMSRLMSAGVDQVKGAQLPLGSRDTVARQSDLEVERAQLEKDILQTLLRHQMHIEDVKEKVAALQSLHNELGKGLNTRGSMSQNYGSVNKSSTGTTNDHHKYCFGCRVRMRRKL